MSDAFARNTDPETSHAAADRVRGTQLELLVLGALVNGGPMTSHEIAARLNLSLVTVSPRIAPLKRAGLVEDSGERRNGRSVWRAL